MKDEYKVRFLALLLVSSSLAGCISSDIFTPEEPSPTDLRNADLTEASLVEADLRNGDLSYARLTNTDLRYADLRNANLSYAYLAGTDFRYADLTGANLTGARILDTNMMYANLDGAIFNNVNLSLRGQPIPQFGIGGVPLGDNSDFAIRFDGANLENTDLSDMTPPDRSVSATNLQSCPNLSPLYWRCVDGNLIGPGALLHDANLSHLGLSYVNLSNSMLYDAIMRNSDLTGAEFNNTDMRYAILVNADLSNASFRVANMEGVNLTGADLTGADLTGASMVGVSFVNADLTGANFTGSWLSMDAIWGNTICPDGTNSSDAEEEDRGCLDNLN